MHPPEDIEAFDKRLRSLTGEAIGTRPFLCDGLPFGCKVFLVGINPGKSSPFWPHWSTQRGCDKQGWLADYLTTHGRFSPTRARIERLFAAVAPIRCLETNVYPTPSAREVHLAKSDHDSRVFDYLLECLRPSVLFVHGNTAVKHVSRLVGEELPLGEFVRVSYRGESFDVIAGYHLSYQWSYAKVEKLGRELGDRCGQPHQDA
jgi:hypothetical protein